MFTEPAITWVSSGFSEYLWRDTQMRFIRRITILVFSAWYSDWLHNTTSAGNSIFVTNHNTILPAEQVVYYVTFQTTIEYDRWYMDPYVLMNLIVSQIHRKLINNCLHMLLTAEQLHTSGESVGEHDKLSKQRRGCWCWTVDHQSGPTWAGPVPRTFELHREPATGRAISGG